MTSSVVLSCHPHSGLLKDRLRDLCDCAPPFGLVSRVCFWGIAPPFPTVPCRERENFILQCSHHPAVAVDCLTGKLPSEIKIEASSLGEVGIGRLSYALCQD